MATTNSLDEAQKLYNKVKSKIKSLPVELKEIINANLLSSLQTDFSALDATEMEDLKNDLAALIDNPSISDEEKKKFQTLQREILSRYPQKLDLLPEHADFLVSRDYLAKLLAENRFQNGSQHRNQGIPAGKIQLQLGVEIEISSVKGYNNLISDYEDAINRKDQKKLEKLDTELAERLILENNKWVQIDNDTLKPGDTDYKDEGTLINNAEKALRDLRKIGYDVEYVRLGGKYRRDETYQKNIEEKLAAAKARPASERIAKVREWAYETLLSHEMTPEKLEALIHHYQQQVDQESVYNVDNHEPLTIFRNAKGHFGTGENHHVIRHREKKTTKEDIEKPVGDLSLTLKGDNPMILNVGNLFTEPGATAKHGDKDVSDQIVVEGADQIDVNKAGTYEVKYIIEVDDVDEAGQPIKKRQEKIRKVEVKEAVEDEKLSLQLKGANPFELNTGETFKDPGAEAFLGAKDVSPDIVVEGIDQIDPHTSGDYEVTYTITKEETINGKKELKTLEEVRVVRVKANENDPVPPPPLPPVKDNENDPVPPPPPPPVEDFEISAVLDDVTASVEDSIAREVENQLKDERNNMSRLNPKKFIRVFNRGAKRKKMIKKALADRKDRGPYLQGTAIENEVSAEADRHELELQNKLGKVSKKAELKLETTTATALNQLAKDFLAGKVNEVDFKKNFNGLITNDTEVKKQRGTHKADFVGSNILEKLKRTKKERAIRGTVASLINDYTSGKDLKALDKIMGEINTFANEFKADPSFRKELLGIDGKIDEGKLEKFIKHHKALEQLGLNNLKIKLDLLGGGEGAYQINNKDRENRFYKFGHWIDKHPWITGFIMAGATLATGGIVGATAGAVAAGWATAGVAGGTVGFKNFIAKRTHHTKEQNTHEKDLTRDYANVKKKMEGWKIDMENKDLPWWKRHRPWGKRYRAKRQYELYETTTQSMEMFADTQQLSDIIMKGLTENALSGDEQNAFNLTVLDAYARLDFYRRKGHNFLKSEDVNKIEQDFHALEKALQLVAERNGGTQMTEIPALISATKNGNVVNYTDLRGEFEKDYAKARTKFGQERAWLATKWGVSTFLLAAGTSIGSQYLFNTGIFSDQTTSITDVANTQTSTQEHFDLGKAELIDGNQLQTTVKDSIQGLGSEDTVKYTFLAGTDGTPPKGIASEKALEAIYNDKLATAPDAVRALHLPPQTETEALKFFQDKAWESARGKNFLTDHLQGSRVIEGALHTLKAHAESGVQSHIELGFDAARSIAGSQRDNVGERVVGVVIDAANKITTTSTTATDHWRSVPFAYFSNTFRRNRPDNAESTEPHYGKDTIVVRNQKQGEVELVKVGKDGELLPGAKFELRDPNGKVIDSWVTDDQPHKITGLDAGKYFIVETQAPAGHQKTDDVVEITVDKDGNVTKRVINKNDIPVDDSKKEKKKSPDDGGDDKEIDSIIKTLKEEVNQGAGGTPLSNKAITGDLNAVKKEISGGADLNHKDRTGKTALILASINHNPDHDDPKDEPHIAIVKELIKEGADLNIQDKNGMTALMWASLNGSIELVKLLIDAGADVNLKDKNGMTARMWLEWAKKQYETEHNKKSYDEAIEALKKAEKKPHENPEKGKSKELSEKKVTFSLPYTKQKIIEIDGMKYNIVRIHKRPVVLVDIAGITVPFYITTGLGGKNLKPGRYPFFGYGKDEWLNKTHGKDMSNYYEKYVGSEVSMMWHSIAKDLAKTYGTDPRVFEDTKDPRDDSEDPLSNFAHKFEDYLNKQLIIIPTDNDTESTLTTVEQNIKDMGTEILFARNDKEHPREKSRENNIELVNVSPEKMNKIFEEHPHVGTLFKALVAQGKLTKLTFDPTTFVSEKRGNEISIGTKYQEGLRYQQNTLFNNETDDLARKLAHEMMHSITPEQVKNNSNLASLFIALKQLRAYDSKKGLSIIVSKYPGTYREANIQATEDMTELFAMYLIDPKHLKDYLSYLTTISKDDSDTLGLKKISPEVAKRIYDQVDTMGKSLLTGGNFNVTKDLERKMHVDEHGEFVFTDHEDVKDNIDEIGKKNAETKQFLEKATWTNNKGVKEILFEPCTLGLAFAIEDTSFFVAGNVNKRGKFVSGTQNTMKIAFPDGTEQEIELQKVPVFGKRLLDFAATYKYKDKTDDIATFIESTHYPVPKKIDQDLFRVDDETTVNIGDEVFVASYYNKKGKITSMIDNALVAGNKLLVITFDDGTELLTAALFVKTPVYSLERVQAMMKWAGIKPIDDDAAEKAKEKAEKAKKARLAEIKTKIGTPSLIQGLAETTKESNSLTLEGVYNGDLIQYWQEILALVPQLKTLTIKGTDKEKLVIGKYASPQIDAGVLNAFRTKLETLALPNNHIEDLDWLKVADPAESISLKTIDLTGNNITDLQYEDFQDLSAETTIIIKDNPINNNLNKIQNFTNGISASGVKAKFVFA